ncbi:MAG TPA: efflux RND transporter periplasmic adaptor subunit [Stellaceae bacterium]|nr:efflux RND transporter periplasmic adaptor subunit [Stellaceae bacterium]
MWRVVIAGLSVLALSVAALLLQPFVKPAPAVAAGPPSAGGQGIPVTAGTVTLADVPVLLSTIGTVQAYNMVTIKSRVDGQLVAADFTEGQEVKAGAPLFRIDPRPYQATFDQTLANQEKDQANLANAQRNFARDSQIIKSNLAVSQQQFDNDKAAVAVDQATVDSDKALAEAARLNLGYCTITAPISGRLGAQLVDVGNLVHASDTTGLVTIAQLKPIYLSFTLPQDQAHKIRERQAIAPLVVRAYGDDNKTLLSSGKLSLIDNAIDQATGTIHLKATFANDDERLWPGEFVNIRLVLQVRKGVPTVPAQTVQEGPEGRYAYIIKPDDTVERRAVEVAAVEDGVAIISKGLSPGEKVVVDGQYRLTNRAHVRLTAPKPGAAG